MTRSRRTVGGRISYNARMAPATNHASVKFFGNKGPVTPSARSMLAGAHKRHPSRAVGPLDLPFMRVTAGCFATPDRPRNAFGGFNAPMDASSLTASAPPRLPLKGQDDQT